jgi:hypothetical protein
MGREKLSVPKAVAAVKGLLHGKNSADRDYAR